MIESIKIIFPFLVLIHGVIHLLGFIKAFNLVSLTRLSQNISRLKGVLWLMTAVSFILIAIFIIMDKESWWVLSFAAILISQYLIFSDWHEAKFGTTFNVILLFATIFAYGKSNFHKQYTDDVKFCLMQSVSENDSILTEEDIQILPTLVQKYLRYTGAVGKPKIKNFKIEFSGQIRKKEDSEWMPFTSDQYNFRDASIRLFFMKANMKHLPVAGYHCFKNGNAFMDIRLFSTFRLQYQAGEEIGIAETVTFFNDMCCMAPASLIDRRIKWLQADSNKVKASFTCNKISITATLYFNNKGELINFVSEDRYAVDETNTMKRIPWSTPLGDYKDFNGIKLAGSAKTNYHFPTGEFCYGNFNLINVKYNVNKFE